MVGAPAPPCLCQCLDWETIDPDGCVESQFDFPEGKKNPGCIYTFKEKHVTALMDVDARSTLPLKRQQIVHKLHK